MKKLILCLMLLAVTFPVMTQNSRDETHLQQGSGGILVVFQDINTNPERLAWVRSLIEDNIEFNTIVIMNTTNTIPPNAFAGSRVEHINFSDVSRITVIPEGAFMDNHTLKLVHLPPSVITIESDAFGNCNNLADIRLPSRLETIADLALWGTKISRMYIPDSVKTIGYDILLYGYDINGFPIHVISSIRLPANATIDSSNPFHSVYIQNGSREGVYVKASDGRWRYTDDVTEEEFLIDGWRFF